MIQDILYLCEIYVHPFQTASHADNESGFLSRFTRKSQESCASDGDSGVGPDSAGSRLDIF